ncbi:hypothetical protein HDV05_007431 [Chytridiales sp. JEL 0842]|nr:hypothetical protein HDV05_007431 [Chytridiales sp. JEL 0842]
MVTPNPIFPYPEHWAELLPSDPYLQHAHLTYLLLGGFICLFGFMSLVIKERLYMSEAMVATAFGVIIGPIAAKQLVPSGLFGLSLDNVTLEFTRTPRVGHPPPPIPKVKIMTKGSVIRNYLWRERLSMFILLGPVMISMWLISAAGVYWIFGMSWLDSMVIAACLTPTDPVLANSIMKGKFAEKHIPLNVRLVLSAESGANDGLGTPFLFLAIYLQRIPNSGQAVGEWIYKVMLYQVAVSIALGAILAYLARKMLKLAERRQWIDKESILSFSISLALFVMGVGAYIGSDDILATFVAGNVLSWDLWFNVKIKAAPLQEVVDNLLNLTYFVFIGIVMPWSDFGGTEGVAIWKLVVFAVWMMVVRRVPIVMALYFWIPSLKDLKEAFFAGWFGPIGAGAIFYAHVAVVYLGYPAKPLIPIVMFTVLSSIIIHGFSVPLFNLSLNKTQTYAIWDKPGSIDPRASGFAARQIKNFGSWNLSTSKNSKMKSREKSVLSGGVGMDVSSPVEGIDELTHVNLPSVELDQQQQDAPKGYAMAPRELMVETQFEGGVETRDNDGGERTSEATTTETKRTALSRGEEGEKFTVVVDEISIEDRHL